MEGPMSVLERDLFRILRYYASHRNEHLNYSSFRSVLKAVTSATSLFRVTQKWSVQFFVWQQIPCFWKHLLRPRDVYFYTSVLQPLHLHNSCQYSDMRDSLDRHDAWSAVEFCSPYNTTGSLGIHSIKCTRFETQSMNPLISVCLPLS